MMMAAGLLIVKLANLMSRRQIVVRTAQMNEVVREVVLAQAEHQPAVKEKRMKLKIAVMRVVAVVVVVVSRNILTARRSFLVREQ